MPFGTGPVVDKSAGLVGPSDARGVANPQTT